MNIGSLFASALLEEHYSPRIYAYYFKHWNDYDMAFHRHDSTEIMYVIHGSCVVEWQEERPGPASARLGKGEFILLDAEVPHRLVVDGSCRMLNVEFGFVPHKGELPSVKTFAEKEASLRELLAVRRASLTLQDPDEVYHSLRSLVLELDYQGGDGKMLDRMLLMQLLIRIGRLRSESERSLAPQAGQYVKASIAYLVQNYDRPLTIREVAASVSLHPGYLQRLFKSQTGRTMIEYLTDIRMEKAKMLLERTAIPIADVSDYVGAGSRAYFHALFKKYTSMTPVEYRAAMDKQRLSEGLPAAMESDDS
ncbi:AraC family transcriptional regulator [Cohnella cellulosilytica]|uniref:AraC family transcriptional regulator n=1 Tax=Cohnella cellulosilytica TaxID=986710 RepID=A0ABW2F6V2_9BACL